MGLAREEEHGDRTHRHHHHEVSSSPKTELLISNLAKSSGEECIVRALAPCRADRRRFGLLDSRHSPPFSFDDLRAFVEAHPESVEEAERAFEHDSTAVGNFTSLHVVAALYASRRIPREYALCELR